MRFYSPYNYVMRVSQAALLAAFMLTIFGLAGCTGKNAANSNSAANSNRASNASEVPKDNSDEFALIVRLPQVPEDVVWKETVADPATSPDPTLTKRLIAVMRFTPENSARLKEELTRVHQAIPESVDSESWYPAELAAQSNVSGDGKIAGQSYAADEFLQEPSVQGKVTHIANTDYFILELF